MASLSSLLLLPDTTTLPHIRLVLQQQSVRVQGYQLYAVEKWLLQRLNNSVLIVYTGHPAHSISLSAYSLVDHSQWDNAINILRRDGARQKQTPHGVLMATSLAHFPSDYSIVLIPDGNLSSLVKDQLYTNINLLRIGCSGRTALTLQDPTNLTKYRFISAYHLPESISSPVTAITSTETLPLPRPRSHSRSNSVLSQQSPSPIRHQDFPPPPPFTATVLELVKLIQAALSIFGLYSSHIDGLLCDLTVDAIHNWILQIGRPCTGLQPSQSVADPAFVAALLSLVLTIRNKLAALGFSHLVPKDPFLHPNIFLHALTAYVNTSDSLSPSSNTLPVPPQITTPSTSASSTSASGSNGSHVVLTRDIISAIGTAYDAKVRSLDGRSVVAHRGRMRKVLKDRLRADSDGGGDGTTGDWGATSGGEASPPTNLSPTATSETSTGAVVASGGQILSGIGSIASGLGLVGVVGAGNSASASGSSSTATGAGMLTEPTCDIRLLVKSIYSKPKTRRTIGKMYDVGNVVVAGASGAAAGSASNAAGPGAAAAASTGVTSSAGEPLGSAYAYHGKDKEKDGGVAMSVKALWSGQVSAITRLREWEVVEQGKKATSSVNSRDRKGHRPIRGSRDIKEHWALSDGDVDDNTRGTGAPKSETEEESDPPFQSTGFGLMWGEKMQKKLGSWTGLARKRTHMSVDMSNSKVSDKESGPGSKYSLVSEATRPDFSRGRSMPVSPTLAPMVFSGGDADADDDDLLSSGQVSPVDNLRPNPFQLLHDGRSLESNSNIINSDYERKITAFNTKGHWVGRIPQNRVSSWADPISARSGLLEEEEGDSEDADTQAKMTKTRVGKVGSWLGGERMLSEEPGTIQEEKEDNASYQEDGDVPTMRSEMYGSKRRRSFHDLESLQQMRVLPVEHMRTDVELAGQLLIMSRREQHLRNVLACLQVLTTRLSSTNARLREDHQSHLPVLADLELRTQIISTIDAENAKADKTSQATHTLRYEAEQFRIPDLWHTVAPQRQKVLELREKAFGMGGRRLPQGVHGAHGKFNRLQWTLDGQERLVDHLGRTEEEAEEEAPGAPYFAIQDEDEDDVVEHPGIKPMWLLRFFTSWGARWGASTAAAPTTTTTTTTSSSSSSATPQNGEDDANKGTATH